MCLIYYAKLKVSVLLSKGLLNTCVNESTVYNKQNWDIMKVATYFAHVQMLARQVAPAERLHVHQSALHSLLALVFQVAQHACSQEHAAEAYAV